MLARTSWAQPRRSRTPGERPRWLLARPQQRLAGCAPERRAGDRVRGQPTCFARRPGLRSGPAAAVARHDGRGRERSPARAGAAAVVGAARERGTTRWSRKSASAGSQIGRALLSDRPDPASAGCSKAASRPPHRGRLQRVEGGVAVGVAGAAAHPTGGRARRASCRARASRRPSCSTGRTCCTRPSCPAPRGVRVRFSPPGVIADDVVRQLVAAEPTGRPVVVVSTDREVAESVTKMGARSVASSALVAVFGR